MLKWLSISALGLLSSCYPSPEACRHWSWRNSSSYTCHSPFRPYFYVLFPQGGQDLSLQPLLCVPSSDTASGVPPGAGGAEDVWGQVDAVQAQMYPFDGRGLKFLCTSLSPCCPCSPVTRLQHCSEEEERSAAQNCSCFHPSVSAPLKGHRSPTYPNQLNSQKQINHCTPQHSGQTFPGA